MIQFINENVSFDCSSLEFVPKWLAEIARREGQKINSLTYIFCSDEYLLSINQQFLNHDYYTDVITFDQRDTVDLPIEGDIFISIDRVQQNANLFSVSFSNELRRVIVHGLLHLLGYDDDTDESKQLIHRLEDKYLYSYTDLYK